MQKNAYSSPAASDELRCRVRLAKQKDNQSVFDAFRVDICGHIPRPDDIDRAMAKIWIEDVTDTSLPPRPVHSRIEQWQSKDSPDFCWTKDMGKLPAEKSVLSDWTAMAKLHFSWLRLPRRGRRNLRFNFAVLGTESQDEIAYADCTFIYENPEPGYMDLQEIDQRVATLAVALAFAVSAVDKKLYAGAIETIRNWALGHIRCSGQDQAVKEELENAFHRTIDFFCRGNNLETERICCELVDISSPGDRYEIMNLCLDVAQTDGVASINEVNLLKDLAQGLGLDMEKFRAMMDKKLPARMHSGQNVELMLGINSDMTAEQILSHLNKEYRKWNARVTNPNPQIQSQADDMLELITQTRSKYRSKT